MSCGRHIELDSGKTTVYNDWIGDDRLVKRAPRIIVGKTKSKELDDNKYDRKSALSNVVGYKQENIL